MQKVNLNRILKDIETDYVKRALESSNNNITNAAELLGLKRTALSERLETLGLEVKRPKWKQKPKPQQINTLFTKHINDIEDELYNE